MTEAADISTTAGDLKEQLRRARGRFAAMAGTYGLGVFNDNFFRQAAMLLAEQDDLVVTLPTLAAQLKDKNPRLVIKEPPLEIPPLELKLAWSPLLQHNPANRWLRQLIVETGREVKKEH